MYQLSVPIMLTSLTSEQRDIYLAQCRKAGVRRIFVAVAELIDIPDEQQEQIFADLTDAVAFVKANRLEAGIWVSTNGHGVVLAHEVGSQKSAKFPPLVRLDGKEWPNTRCPLDEDYQAYIERLYQRLAAIGADIIMLDDDFRLSQHHPEFCCVCERHMEKIREACGEEIAREDVRRLVFEGKPSKYRDAWLKAEGESLYELARIIRRAVNSVNPSVRIAYCASNTIWDIDGTDPVTLAKIFAGNTKPIMRLTGALYSLNENDKSYFMILEVARSLAAITREQGVELMAEGDCYPRPRYHIPAAYLENYDMIMRINGGYDGILKYMFDYVSSPLYETGYLDRHVRHLPIYDEIDRLFGDGKLCGVNVVFRPHLIQNADFTLSPATYYSPFASAGILLANASISTTYNGEGICNAMFGEQVREATEEELEKGVLLDSVSAQILSEQGYDVGLRGKQETISSKAGLLFAEKNTEQAVCRFGQGSFLQTELAKNAETLLEALVDGKRMPILYRYQNTDGKRFLVFLFDLMTFRKNTSLIRGYIVQSAVVSGVEWVAGKKLPAVSLGNPNLYTICKRTENSLSVALFNSFADEVLDPSITLDSDAYTELECIHCTGHIEGNRVLLDAPIPAFGFAAFRVKSRPSANA